MSIRRYVIVLAAMSACRFDPSGTALGTDTDADVNAMGWWDQGFGFRIPLVIDETTPGPLSSGYSVAVTPLDTAAGVAAGTMQPDGDDLRVVRFDGAAHQELHRRVIAMNTDSTEIWFKTTGDIDISDTSYALYYGNPTAGSPPAYWSDSMGADAPSQVYLAADDFQEHTAADCPDGWGPCGTTWLVDANGSERLLIGTGSGEYLLAGDRGWTDVSVEAEIRSTDPDGCPGIASRVEDENNLVYAGYYCDSNKTDLISVPLDNVALWPRIDGNHSPLFGVELTIGTEWHTLGVAWTGDVARLYHDGDLVGMGTAPAQVALAGHVGLFSTYSTTLFADNVVVRRFVDPEPSVSAGAPQSAP